MAKRLELPAQVMCPNACLHADQARRNVGEPSIDLAARQLLAQNDRALLVEADEMERILANVDADRVDDVGADWHGMLLILAAPDQTLRLDGAGARRVHPITGRLEKQTSD